MRITESKIRQIIREEARRVLREGEKPEGDPSDPSYRSAMRRYYKAQQEPEPKRRTSGLSRFPGMDDDDLDPDPIPAMWFNPNRDDLDDLDEGAFPEEIEGVYGKAPPEMVGSPRAKLESYLVDNGGEELVDAVMSAVDSALKRAMDKGDEAPTSEDVTFNLSDETLDMIPEGDEDEWHEMLDAVLEDEFDAGAFEESEADRESEEETRRDLGHSSNFIPSRRSRY
jgi:hypothetical protein